MTLGLVAGVLWMGSRRRGATAFGALAAILLLTTAIAIVPPGHVGVPVLFGRVSEATLYEGLNLVNPLATVERFSVRTETYSMNSSVGEGGRADDSIYVLSADGVAMPMDVSVAYRLVEADAPWVFRHLGRGYVASILRPAARSAIPEAVSKYTFQDAYSVKREEMADRMRQLMTARIRNVLTQYGFKGSGILVQEIFLRKIQLPPNLKEAIEQKMRSEQEAARMTFVLQREEREAERKRIEAKGIRDFQAIVTEGISDKLLQWKGIEATRTD